MPEIIIVKQFDQPQGDQGDQGCVYYELEEFWNEITTFKKGDHGKKRNDINKNFSQKIQDIKAKLDLDPEDKCIESLSQKKLVKLIIFMAIDLTASDIKPDIAEECGQLTYEELHDTDIEELKQICKTLAQQSNILSKLASCNAHICTILDDTGLLQKAQAELVSFKINDKLYNYDNKVNYTAWMQSASKALDATIKDKQCNKEGLHSEIGTMDCISDFMKEHEKDVSCENTISMEREEIYSNLYCCCPYKSIKQERLIPEAAAQPGLASRFCSKISGAFNRFRSIF